MKLVVDTNILITFFWKHSITHELFENQSLELFSPAYALEEIEACSGEILNRAKISRSEFDASLKQLSTLIQFIPLREYAPFLRKAVSLCPDKDDCDFFALSITLQSPLWSQDKKLKNQTSVKVFNTREVVQLFD